MFKDLKVKTLIWKQRLSFKHTILPNTFYKSNPKSILNNYFLIEKICHFTSRRGRPGGSVVGLSEKCHILNGLESGNSYLRYFLFHFQLNGIRWSGDLVIRWSDAESKKRSHRRLRARQIERNCFYNIVVFLVVVRHNDLRTLGVDFINICARLLGWEAFFGAQRVAKGEHIWQTAHRFGKFCKHFSRKFLVSIVGEIERRIFCRTLCAGVFSLGAQSLMKSTLGEILLVSW